MNREGFADQANGEEQNRDSEKADNVRSPAKTSQDIIEQGERADCWICADIFRRRTQTRRYCAKCQRGFCEGWHGSLSRGYGTCIICEETMERSQHP